MAGRIRTIKPELLENPRTARLPDAPWRLFVSLLLLADDYGNAHADPALLSGAVFWGAEPGDHKVLNSLRILVERDLISLYESRGQPYLNITGWTEHQKVDKPGRPRVPTGKVTVVRADSSVPGKVPGDLAGTTRLISTCTSTNDPDHDRDLFEDGQRQLKPDPLTELTHGLLEELNDARGSVIEGSRRLRPVEDNLKHIRARLEEGCTVEEIRHVIAVRAAEVKAKPSSGEWFNAITPFRPENFQRTLASTPKLAAMPPQAAQGSLQRAFERPGKHPPSNDEIERQREQTRIRDEAHARKELAAAGYTWDEQGNCYDPDGRLLDKRGRVVKAAAAAVESAES